MKSMLLPLVLVAPATGCLEGAWNGVTDNFTEPSTSSFSTGDEPDTGPTEGPAQTVTGEPEDTGTPTETSDPGTTTSEPLENTPPEILHFVAEPDHLSEAGSTKLLLEVSSDVIGARLFLDGEQIPGVTLADFPYIHEVFSAKDNDKEHMFSVEVWDDEMLSDAADTPLSVDVPPSGAEKCTFEDTGADSIVAALEYTHDAIYAVGSRDTGSGYRITAWKLDPDNCTLVDGWPKTIDNWNLAEQLPAAASFGTAVDIDSSGNVLVAGNFMIGGKKPQSYVALLTPLGSRLWEKLGTLGDEVSGVAAGAGQHQNRVFVVGSRRTSDEPALTDALFAIYTRVDETVHVSAETLKAPFDPDEYDEDKLNLRSERARAVVIEPGTGYARVVGEREVFDLPGNQVYSRGFAARVHPLGGLVDIPWTSVGPASIHDGIHAVAVCGGEFVAAGWTRDEAPTSKPRPLMFWLDADGAATKHRDDALVSTQTFGVACDREGKIVSAGTRDAGGFDAQVFAVLDPFSVRHFYDEGVVGDDAAGAVSCDRRGFCGWGGYRTVDSLPRGVIRVHHP